MDIREIRRRNLAKLMEREFGNVRGAQSRMAERLGQHQSFISRCLAAPDSSGAKTIGEDLARSIEKEFKLPRYALDKDPFMAALPAPAVIDSNTDGVTLQIKSGLVPVKGKAMLGDDGYFDEMDYPPGAGDGYLQFYSDDPDAYALRVVGSSMEPRIRSGEFVTIEPNQTYMAGDEVLVRTQDGRAMIKVFMYHRDGEIRLLSINDAHPPLSIPETTVTLIHPVSAIVKPSRLVEL